ncbi:hypothetical protein [Sulfitobacter guttiformis]|jgi:hypothetical protein|uniref:Uncharacterized protein n=1 Tax=Sulfitobacter guttiformis TaxID=74349 RepID=A0A420DPH8_9RHOB|nr:hypothetical protein [Sulfitobacter guttiformis]KIN73532.1 hypothetical protein Z949_2723 [Sulfitobacter guttiformis KCTC 32187]RKE96181.1 hypothetical protein C8N30_0734 [Sulfitobacter guttiformis]
MNNTPPEDRSWLDRRKLMLSGAAAAAALTLPMPGFAQTQSDPCKKATPP